MADVADRLNQELGIEIDRRKLEGESLRQVGEHQIAVRLSAEYAPQVTAVVLPEGAPLETALPVAAAPEAPVEAEDEEE
jgi:hypothetical protein